MSRAELELLDRHTALARERCRTACVRAAGDVRAALDPSPWIRSNPQVSMISAFVLAWMTGRALRGRRTSAAAPPTPEAADRPSRDPTRRSPLRPLLVLMRFARSAARRWIVGSIIERWTESPHVEHPAEPRVA